MSPETVFMFNVCIMKPNYSKAGLYKRNRCVAVSRMWGRLGHLSLKTERRYEHDTPFTGP